MPISLRSPPDSASPTWPVRVASACAASSACLPFLPPFHGPPLQSFYQEWIAMLLGAGAFVALGRSADGRRIEIPRPAVLPLGLTVLIAVQVALGRVEYWQQGVLGALFLLWACAMLGVGYRLRSALGWERFVTLLAWSLLVGALASAAIAAAQMAGWRLGGWVLPLASARVYGNVGQPNHFADYLFLGLASVVYLAATRRLSAVAAAPAAALLLLFLDLSGSRSAWLYLLAAAVLAGAIHARIRLPQTKRALLWSGALLAAFALVQWSAPLVAPDRNETASTAGARLATDQAGVPIRLQRWHAALLMSREAPLLGAGYGAFAWHRFLQGEALGRNLEPGVADNAHNFAFQVLAEFGVAGGALVALAAFFWLDSQRRAPLSVEKWWAAALLATIALHSMFEYPLWYAYFLGLFCLVLGATEDRPWRFEATSLDRVAYSGAAVLAAWALATALIDYRRLEEITLAPRTVLRQEQLLALHGKSLFTHLVEFDLSRTISPDEWHLGDKIALNGRAMRYLPKADMVYRQSLLLALDGRWDEACRQWDLAVAAFPGEREAATKLLRDLLSQGRAAVRPLVEYAASRSKEP